MLDAGRAPWRKFHATAFARKIRDEFKLNRPDAGWYQIRKALEANEANELTDFTPFKAAYAALEQILGNVNYLNPKPGRPELVEGLFFLQAVGCEARRQGQSLDKLRADVSGSD